MAAGLAACGCSSGPPQDLLGPAPQVGQKYRNESKMTIVNGKITARDGNATETGRIDITSETIEEVEILGVSGSRVTKSRVHVVSDKTQESIQAGGENHSRDEPSPLQGETIEFEKNGEDWKITLLGKTPNAKQTQGLDAYPPPWSDVDFYPRQPVKPGYRWDVDVKLLKGLMGRAVQIESGSCTRKFEKMIQWDGEPCAQIAEEMEVRGRARDESGQWLQLELKLAGSIKRSPAQGFSLAAQMTGTMTVSGTLTEGGKKLQMTVSGPRTMEWRTFRK
jgi:hypothetical protein